MSELKTNLQSILQEKNTKIIPQNIKKDIEVLGVTGSYDKEDIHELEAELADAEQELADVRRDLDNSTATISGSGETVTLNGTAEARFKKPPLPMGNSEQFTTIGKNLLLLETLTEQTVNDVTFTPVYKNGLLQYINVNGTSTANTRYYLNASQSDSYYPITFYGLAYNTDYYISGGISDQSVYIFFGGNDITDVVNYTGDTSGSFAENRGYRLCLRVDSGKTITNQRIYPMVRLQTVSDNSYEPYTGGIASPNPNYPQTVTNVTGDVEVKVQNKNLFDVDNFNTVKTGITTSRTNNKIILNGTATNLGAINFYDNNTANYVEYISNPTTTKLKAGTYTISLNNINGTQNDIYCNLLICKKKPTIPNTLIAYFSLKNQVSTSFTLDTESDIYLGIQWSANKIFNNFSFDIQLEKSTTPTTYTPHQEQVLPLTLGNIELCKIGDYQNYFRKSTGKNLLNIVDSESGGIDSSGIDISGSNLWRDSGYIEVKPNTSYTLSRKAFSDNVPRVIRLYEYDNDKLFVSPRQESATDSLTIITGINTKYIRWSIFEQNSTLTELVVKDWNLQIEQNSSVTEYEPYGKVWYLYKEIEKRIFNGTENWTLNSSVSSENYKVFYLYNTGMLVEANVLCNNFIYINSRGTANCIWTPYSTELDISISYSIADTVEAFKTWLSTHNTIVYYPLATPTNTEITDTTLISQLEAIRKAISYDKQTNVSSNMIALFDVIALRNMNDTLNTLENEIELLP